MTISENSEKRRPRVLVSMDLARDCYRKVFEGILKRSRERNEWELDLDMTPRTGSGFSSPAAGARYDGLLLLYRNPRQMKAVVRFKGPALIIHPPQPLPAAFPRRLGLTYVIRDQAEISRTVADYFLARFYRSFAFLGEGPAAFWSTAREAAYVSILHARGCACSVFRQRTGLDQPGTIDYGRIGRWLKELPRPTALYAANDRLSRLALDICHDEFISVPGELAILGVDNDVAICETAIPALSSVAVGHVNMGERCVDLLAEMLDGSVRPCRRLSLGQPEVVGRRSTDAFCFKDPLLVRAFRLMAAAADSPLTITALAGKLGLSRRMLEIRARHELGHPLKEEWQRLRLMRVAAWLRNSRLTVAEIAAREGFFDSGHLIRAFKARFSLTPQAYRNDSLRLNRHTI